jgi:hypothetical protein
MAWLFAAVLVYPSTVAPGVVVRLVARKMPNLCPMPASETVCQAVVMPLAVSAPEPVESTSPPMASESTVVVVIEML